MLSFLRINLLEPQARRFFNLIDADGGGLMDIDEFKVCLQIDSFLGPSVAGGEGKTLQPVDVFTFYDELNQGFLEFPEFVEVSF